MFTKERFMNLHVDQLLAHVNVTGIGTIGCTSLAKKTPPLKGKKTESEARAHPEPL